MKTAPVPLLAARAFYINLYIFFRGFCEMLMV